MVSISRECEVQSERRLRAVLRAARLEHLPGAWWFRRVGEGVPEADALALVRDADGWCALVPAGEGAGERFGVSLTTFPDGIDNSGYVGWLATAVKRRLGSGVFVVCGDNPRRGGIFDYLGYPWEVADGVRAAVDALRVLDGGRPAALDLIVFDVVEVSPASTITRDTVFEFREGADGVVEARYAGGGVVTGTLLGRRERDTIVTAYTQLGSDGAPRTGTAVLRVRPAPDGHLLLTEDYTWSDGTPGRNVLRSRERSAA